MARGEFASGEVLPLKKVTIHFYSWKIGCKTCGVFIRAEKLFSIINLYLYDCNDQVCAPRYSAALKLTRGNF